MTEILQQFEQLRVVPVVAIPNAIDANPLADALIQGGLPCVEITFRTEAAIDAMKIMAKRADILVGAGTALTIEQVKAAVDAGARFIVSPGFNPQVVGYCVDNQIAITPGISTPSDIEAALSFGIEVVKFFPAEAFGGLKTLKAMSGPYAKVKYIPTGGITPQNLKAYLQFPKVLACGGTWIAKSELISAGHFDTIQENAKQAVSLVKESKAAN